MTPSMALELRGTLGKDGLGWLFSARSQDPADRTPIWVRWIPPGGLHDTEHSDRVWRIQEALSGLTHPFIPRLLGHGKLDHGLALAFAQPMGTRLSALRPGTWNNDTAWALLHALAEGLQALHSATQANTGEALELVHRGLSADGLYLRRDGGLACWETDTIRGTWAGHRESPSERLGHRHAPEQLRGLDSQASDIFEVGVIVAKRLVQGPGPVDPALVDLLSRCRAAEQDQRPTAAELLGLAGDHSGGLAAVAQGLDVPWDEGDALHGLVGEVVEMARPPWTPAPEPSPATPPPASHQAPPPSATATPADLRNALPHDRESLRRLLAESRGDS